MRVGMVGLALALFLSGCGQGLPRGQEMDRTALIRTLGVDVGEKSGERLLTASTARRSRGLQGDGQPPLILSARRPSLTGACLAMQQLSDSYVFFGHSDQLLLGEELIRRGGVEEVLDYVCQDAQLSLGMQVWAVRGNSAQNALHAGDETGVNDRLNSLQEDEEMGLAQVKRTAGEVLTDLLENGSAYLPALTLGQKAEDTHLLESGYGVLTEDGLAGWLTGEEARGLELLQEHPGGQILELDGVSVRLERTVLTCLPVVEGKELAGLELDIRLVGRVAQQRNEGRSREEVEAAVERLQQERARLTLERLRRWNADCLSLKKLAGAARPEVWDIVWRQWEEKFPELDIRVRCTAGVTGLEE